MKRKSGRLAKLLIAVVILLLLLLLLFKCSDNPESQPAASIRVYPGANVDLAVDDRQGVEVKNDSGKVLRSGEGGFVFHAPLENGTSKIDFYQENLPEPFASREVIVAMPAAQELKVVDLLPGQGAVLSYGGVRIEIEASGVDSARVVFIDEAPSERLVVVLEGETAYIEWQGSKIDGLGPLSESEDAALRDLATSSLARALTMAGLDLGCLIQENDLPASAHAALLLPWQLILKYQIMVRKPVISHFISRSACGFDNSPVDMEGKPVNAVVHWDRANVIPATLFHFPLDGTGQMGEQP